MHRFKHGLWSFLLVLALQQPEFIVAQTTGTDASATVQATATTTDSLNLRSGPGLSFSVISVLPAGVQVDLTGLADTNGFRSVSFEGQNGWAFGAYLADDAASPSPNATATTTDSLNLRSGAALSASVVTILPAGAIVTLTGQNVNGFRSVTYMGFSGWAFGAYLDLQGTPTPPPSIPPGSQGTVISTTAVNLRTGPGTSFAVIVAIPANSRMMLTGQNEAGFSPVSFNGRVGWVSAAYLTMDGTMPETANSATTTSDLNVRSGPATSYSILIVIPSGQSLTLTGQTSNGFHSVSWNGYSGWAFSTYLAIGGVQPPPPPTSESGAPFDTTNSIVGPARGNADQAITFARAVGAVRIGEVERYVQEIYRLAPQIGFDPALLIAQSALETDYWRSDWWAIRLNPAGIGVTGDPQDNSDSPYFTSGTKAARAQIAHMHAEVFGRSKPLPADLQGVDPTYQQVFEAGWAGTIRTLEDLVGTWAEDDRYAFRIVSRANEIF